MDREDNIDFLEFVDVAINDENAPRLPKRYIRDMENPIEFYGDNEFRTRYRFSKHTVVNSILPLVAGHLEKINNRGLPFLPIYQLLICLRFYATGNFQTVTGDLRGASQQTISVITKRVSTLLAEQLNNYVKFPDQENEQHENISLFRRIHGFPGVAACIDCTHIPITSPGGDHPEVFRNRKGYFSVNVQAAVGPRMEILDIVVRHPGSTHDSVIFDRSALRVRFEQGYVHGLLLGDSGYPCRPYLLTPVLQPATPQEIRYNSAHIHTRNIVERVFGIWKRKFACLRRCLSTKLNTSLAIICATSVLHNIGIQQNDYERIDIEIENPEIPQPIIIHNNQLGLLFRGEFINQHFAN